MQKTPVKFLKLNVFDFDLRIQGEYTFYKSSFYKKYCKLLGIKEAKKNEKYVHYLELINQLIETYIKPDKELISKVRSYIPDY